MIRGPFAGPKSASMGAMDPSELRKKLEEYASRDAEFRASGSSVPEEASIDNGLVTRDSFLHIYRRRLKRVGDDADLRVITERLVSFLEEYTEEELSMITYRTQDGEMRMFLADKENRRILFWMSMFK
jgi:hypothetical protein